MTRLEELERLYGEYLARAHEAEANRKPLDGAFGFGKKSADDPCHDRFAQALEHLLLDIRAQAPPSGEVRDALDAIYRAPLDHPWPLSAHWMLKAVHGMTAPLADLLTAADARALYDAYARDYPRWDRLPSQKQALRALDAAGYAVDNRLAKGEWVCIAAKVK